jgi:hypothetical protein
MNEFPEFVMPGLDPAIQRKNQPVFDQRWIAGSSQATTENGYAK